METITKTMAAEAVDKIIADLNDRSARPDEEDELRDRWIGLIADQAPKWPTEDDLEWLEQCSEGRCRALRKAVGDLFIEHIVDRRDGFRRTVSRGFGPSTILSDGAEVREAPTRGGEL